MTALRATADLFAPLPDLNTDVLAGLDLLARSPPLWPIETERWSNVLAVVRAFEEAHGDRARACGWSDLSLYGLHRNAPYANLAAMGAAFLVARSGHRVAAVTTADVLVVAPTGAMLRIFRSELDQGAVLAWSIRAAG